MVAGDGTRDKAGGAEGEAGAGGRRKIAVALSYRPGDGDDAPRVVATGRGQTAEKILQLAFDNGVRVREDADLAEILSAVDIDSVIPLEAFMAVAEILTYVYRANRQALPVPPAPSPPPRLPPGLGGRPEEGGLHDGRNSDGPQRSGA